MTSKKPYLHALQISGVYFLIAGLWIVFSDRLASAWFPSVTELSRVSQYKGLAFVVVTTLLLYAALKSRLTTIERSQRAVESSERLFAAFMENLPVVAFLRDSAGRYVYVNRYWLDRFSGGKAWKGKFPRDFFDADFLRTAEEDHERILRGEPVFERVLTLPVGGSDRQFLVRRFPVKADDELLVGACAIDITEQRKLEEQLHQAAKMEAIGHLAGGIAHDFNNLLTVIGGYAQLLSGPLASSTLVPRAAAEIMKASERAARLTAQLLISSRKQVARLESIDLNASIQALLSVIDRLVGENIRIEQDLAAGLPSIVADRIQIDQVLMNIIVNARDAMPLGGAIRVQTKVQSLGEHEAHPLRLSEGQFIVLSVADEGHGMDERTTARIFEPFFTTKEPGKGTGLGLATVYGIVQSCGGAIRVESEVGVGSTFHVYLPVTEKASQEAVDSRAAPAGDSVVLLVEDDEAVRGLAEEFLKSCGYTVLTSASGAEALEMYRDEQDKIRLLISDVAMPGMGGPDLLRRLRVINPDIRALFLTGYSADVREGMVLSGDVPVLPKPFTIEELATAVQKAIGASHA